MNSKRLSSNRRSNMNLSRTYLKTLLSLIEGFEEEKKEKKTQEIVNLLNLEDDNDVPTIEEHGYKLAL